MLWSLPLVPAIAALGFLGLRPAGRPALGAFAGVILAMTLALSALAAAGSWRGSFVWSDALVLTAALTPISAAVAILVPAIALPVALYAAGHEARDGLPRLLGLMLIFVGGMELLVIADDFLTLLIGWEIVGACSWALIGHRWTERPAVSAGIYAFVTTRIGDVGLFLAAFAVWAGAGSFAFDAIPQLSPTYLQIVAFGVLVSAAAKSGQVPFSPWLFRAMAGPTSVSALLHAAAMVAAGAYLVSRLAPMLQPAEGFKEAAIAVGIATALAGGVVAVQQSHAKKLLAASTSAQYGLMFAAAGAGWPGVAALHLIAHAMAKALLFLSAGIAGERAGTYSLDRMGFGRALPWTAAMSGAGALALAGVPPLGAAWTKEEITAGVIDASLLAGALSMIAGGLGAAYAARFQTLAFYPAQEAPEGHRAGPGAMAGIALLAAGTLASSVLWIPAVGKPVRGLLDTGHPPSGTAELVIALLLVAIGLLAGVHLALRKPGLGRGGTTLAGSEWLGLPVLIRHAIVQPFEALARIAAAADDRVIDGAICGIAAGFRAGSSGAGTADTRAVDRGVELIVAVTEWAARNGDRLGERIAEGLPAGSAWLAGNSGRDLRLLQTGLSHHYYALLALGAAAATLLLIALGG